MPFPSASPTSQYNFLGGLNPEVPQPSLENNRLKGIGMNSHPHGEHGRAIARTTAKRYCPIVRLALLTTVWAFSYSLNAQELKTSAPNLDLILDNLERAEEQNAALSRPYEVARQYILFRRADRKPYSEVTAQINFTPPNIKTFNISEEQGNPRGKKIIRDVLEQEITSTKAGHKGDVRRSNYDFVFLREENFGAVPEYVLHIIPKRQEKGLLLGDIWVDAKTYRIRQIIGIPLKSPSFWIKDLHITLRFAAVNDMWISTSVDAIATVRFLGIYTLSGRDLAPPRSASSTPGP
jgi:hypothetical protein